MDYLVKIKNRLLELSLTISLLLEDYLFKINNPICIL